MPLLAPPLRAFRRLASRRSPGPPSGRARGVSLALLAALLARAPAEAAAQSLVYGLQEKGKLSVNGTVLDSMSSGFDEETGENFFQRWQHLVVAGADRYALRLDGKLYKNGKSLHKLPFGVTVTSTGSVVYSWIALDHGASGIYALREDGLLTLDGTSVVTLPRGDFVFTDCLAVDNEDATASDIYCLRSDGAVYRNALTTSPDLKFTGGPGLHTGTNPTDDAEDGEGTETVWVALAWDPATETLRGLRRDGKVSSGAELAVPGPQPLDPDLMALPFPATPAGVDSDAEQNANRYRSLRFTDSGTWHAVRGNGQIYTQASLLEPLVDLPGAAGELDDTYVDVATLGEDFWTIRWDGRFYEGTGTSPVLDLTGSRYRDIEASAAPPDLTNFKNPKPILSTYTVTVVEGSAFSVPVYATDIEKTGSDLVVTLLDPLKKPLPAGLEFTAGSAPGVEPVVLPTISWDNATPKGSYTVPLVVSDGVNKPKTYNYKVKVVLPDAKPEKNKKPLFTKVKKPQALVGFPYELQILAVDADPGDTVTLSVDETKGPFAIEGSDAAFDPQTGLFTWTPTFEDIGKHKVKFFATDSAQGVSSYTVSISVVNSLIF